VNDSERRVAIFDRIDEDPHGTNVVDRFDPPGLRRILFQML
jgi:hypothetical protein